MKLILFSCLSVTAMVWLSSCKPFDPDDNVPPKQTEGWAPVYSKTATTIKSAGARSIENGGKIYIKDKRLYQIETGKGIHALDISNPSDPKKIAFIEIAGCQEVSVLGNMMYANNLNDLVTIDISDISNVKEIDRRKDAFHLLDRNRPPSAGWFECIDASKGEVTGWELKTLYSPRCLY